MHHFYASLVASSTGGMEIRKVFEAYQHQESFFVKNRQHKFGFDFFVTNMQGFETQFFFES